VVLTVLVELELTLLEDLLNLLVEQVKLVDYLY
jgi:hypothetical protein